MVSGIRRIIPPPAVHANVPAPGPAEMLDERRRTIPGGVEARIAATPSRKAGTGAEAGSTRALPIGDRASHLSGVVVPVGGGFTA